MSFVGGAKVMDFRLLSQQTGAIARNCIATFVSNGPKHAVFGLDDCSVTDGTNIAFLLENKWRRWIYTRIDTDYYMNSFTVAHPREQEIWFCFPEGGSRVCTMALIWNWATNQFGIRELPEAACGTAGIVTSTGEPWDTDWVTWDGDTVIWNEDGGSPVRRTVVVGTLGTDSRRLYDVEVGNTFDVNLYNSSVTRTGLTVIRQDAQGGLISDLTQRKLLREVWPMFEAVAGTPISIEVGVQDSFSVPVTWSSPMTFTVGVDEKVTPLVAGRILSLRFSSSVALSWRLLGYDLTIEPLGVY
jgi:hypothetical protein